MTAQSGAAFLLKITDGASPPNYQTVAGLRTTQLSIAGQAVVITTKDSNGWRDLLNNGGARSISVSAAGVFMGSAAEGRIRGN
ncbi:MAG TPA: phage tail tube protein, partial [Novosphingobium sp.]|nr:phage tail tube protein [Novosphingobium sp.]